MEGRYPQGLGVSSANEEKRALRAPSSHSGLRAAQAEREPAEKAGPGGPKVPPQLSHFLL